MICKVKDCPKPSRSRGWCWGHYRRFLRYGSPTAVVSQGTKLQKERYGDIQHKRNSARGGSAGKRGYFGTLKDAGEEAELKALSKKGIEARKGKESSGNKAKLRGSTK